jgi:hypothetical protein
MMAYIFDGSLADKDLYGFRWAMTEAQRLHIAMVDG